MAKKKSSAFGSVVGVLLIVALLFFEAFNYSTTEFALGDLLGNFNFFGIKWATLLAVAFCGIDFAGLVRLFDDDDKIDKEVYYLFGAWIPAATMNALLTWWGVSVALLAHTPQGTPLLGKKALMDTVPVFIAVLVWLTRILLIGTLTVLGPKIAGAWVSTVLGAQGLLKGPKAKGGASVGSTRTAARRSSSGPLASGTPREPSYEPLRFQGKGQEKRLV